MDDEFILREILKGENVAENIQCHLPELLTIIPEIEYMIDFPHCHPHHHLDVWKHTLLALSMSENDFEVRITLLLHDIGKPFSYQDGEVRHFKGHAEKSCEMAEKILERIGFNKEFISKICYLIKHHDLPIQQEDINQNFELQNNLYKIQYCDAMAHNPNYLQKRIEYLHSIEELMNDAKRKKYSTFNNIDALKLKNKK